MFLLRRKNLLVAMILLGAPLAHASHNKQSTKKQIAHSFGKGALCAGLLSSTIFTQENVPPHAGKFVLSASLAGGILNAGYTGFSLFFKNRTQQQKIENTIKKIDATDKLAPLFAQYEKIMRDEERLESLIEKEVAESAFYKQLDKDKIKLSIQKYGKVDAYSLKNKNAANRYNIILNNLPKKMLTDPYAKQKIFEYITDKKNDTLNPLRLVLMLKKKYASWENLPRYRQFDPWKEFQSIKHSPVESEDLQSLQKSIESNVDQQSLKQQPNTQLNLQNERKGEAEIEQNKPTKTLDTKKQSPLFYILLDNRKSIVDKNGLKSLQKSIESSGDQQSLQQQPKTQSNSQNERKEKAEYVYVWEPQPAKALSPEELTQISAALKKQKSNEEKLEFLKKFNDKTEWMFFQNMRAQLPAHMGAGNTIEAVFVQLDALNVHANRAAQQQVSSSSNQNRNLDEKHSEKKHISVQTHPNTHDQPTDEEHNLQLQVQAVVD